MKVLYVAEQGYGLKSTDDLWPGTNLNGFESQRLMAAV
jgi:hypothetical protein